MINREQYRKLKDKKVLHKVHKRWLVVSTAVLGMIGAGTLSASPTYANTVKAPTTVSAGSNVQHAQTNQQSATTVKPSQTVSKPAADQQAKNVPKPQASTNQSTIIGRQQSTSVNRGVDQTAPNTSYHANGVNRTTAESPVAHPAINYGRAAIRTGNQSPVQHSVWRGNLRQGNPTGNTQRINRQSFNQQHPVVHQQKPTNTARTNYVHRMSKVNQTIRKNVWNPVSMSNPSNRRMASRSDKVRLQSSLSSISHADSSSASVHQILQSRRSSVKSALSGNTWTQPSYASDAVSTEDNRMSKINSLLADNKWSVSTSYNQEDHASSRLNEVANSNSGSVKSEAPSDKVGDADPNAVNISVNFRYNNANVGSTDLNINSGNFQNFSPSSIPLPANYKLATSDNDAKANSLAVDYMLSKYEHAVSNNSPVSINVVPDGSNSNNSNNGNWSPLDENVNFVDNGSVVGHGTINVNSSNYRNLNTSEFTTPRGYKIADDSTNEELNNISMIYMKAGYMRSVEYTVPAMIQVQPGVNSNNMNPGTPQASQPITINYLDNGVRVGGGTINGTVGQKVNVVDKSEGGLPVPGGYALSGTPNTETTYSNTPQTFNLNVTKTTYSDNFTVHVVTRRPDGKGGWIADGMFSKDLPISENGNLGDKFTVDPSDQLITNRIPNFQAAGFSPDSTDSAVHGTFEKNGLSTNSVTFYYNESADDADGQDNNGAVNVNYIDGSGHTVQSGQIRGALDESFNVASSVPLASGYQLKNGSDQNDTVMISDHPQTINLNVVGSGNSNYPNANGQDTDVIDYQYNGSIVGSTVMRGKDGITATADGSNMPNGYKLADDGSQGFAFNNSTHRVDVLPTGNNGNNNSNNNNNHNGNNGNNNNDVQGTDYDLINFVYNNYIVHDETMSGRDGSIGTVNVRDVPKGYQIAQNSATSFNFNGGVHTVNVVPIPNSNNQPNNIPNSNNNKPNSASNNTPNNTPNSPSNNSNNIQPAKQQGQVLVEYINDRNGNIVSSKAFYGNQGQSFDGQFFDGMAPVGYIFDKISDPISEFSNTDQTMQVDVHPVNSNSNNIPISGPTSGNSDYVPDSPSGSGSNSAGPSDQPASDNSSDSGDSSNSSNTDNSDNQPLAPNASSASNSSNNAPSNNSNGGSASNSSATPANLVDSIINSIANRADNQSSNNAYSGYSNETDYPTQKFNEYKNDYIRGYEDCKSDKVAAPLDNTMAYMQGYEDYLGGRSPLFKIGKSKRSRRRNTHKKNYGKSKQIPTNQPVHYLNMEENPANIYNSGYEFDTGTDNTGYEGDATDGTDSVASDVSSGATEPSPGQSYNGFTVMQDQNGIYILVNGIKVYWDPQTDQFDLVMDQSGQMMKCNNQLLAIIQQGNNN